MLHPPIREPHLHGRCCSAVELWHAGPSTSEIRFRLRHLVVTKIDGRAARWQAELFFDFDEPSRSWVDVVIDAASLETGAVERDNHIRSAEFLDVVAFPTIRFRSHLVRAEGPGRYQIIGDLTIRDVTREVTLAVEGRPPGVVAATEPRPAFKARTTINRQGFGLHWNQDLDSGGVVVGDEIEIEIALEAHRGR